MDDSADLVIIGGGIVGCASAYFAAREGLRVVLVEKGQFGFEQSSRNWGWVTAQVNHRHMLPLSLLSLDIWSGLEEALGEALDWAQAGHMRLFSSEGDLNQASREKSLDGVERRIYGRDDVVRLLPGIHGDWSGAQHILDSGQADPRLVTMAIARGAEASGARLYPGCAAEAIEIGNGAVRAVVTEQGTIRTSRAVCATGAWSRRFLRPLGLSVPNTALRLTVMRTEPADPITRTLFSARVGDGSMLAVRQDGHGRFILATVGAYTYDVTHESLADLRDFWRLGWRNRDYGSFGVGRLRAPAWRDVREVEPKPSLAMAERNLRNLIGLFPGLEGLGIESIWGGNSDMTPDQTPVVDGLDTPKGLIVATGLSGHGFALGPGVGKVVSELAAGKIPSVNVTPLRYARFAAGEAHPLGTWP